MVLLTAAGMQLDEDYARFGQQKSWLIQAAQAQSVRIFDFCYIISKTFLSRPEHGIEQHFFDNSKARMSPQFKFINPIIELQKQQSQISIYTGMEEEAIQDIVVTTKVEEPVLLCILIEWNFHHTFQVGFS